MKPVPPVTKAFKITLPLLPPRLRRGGVEVNLPNFICFRKIVKEKSHYTAIQTLDFRLQASGFFKRNTKPCRFFEILLLDDLSGVTIHPLIALFLRIWKYFLRALLSEVCGLPSESWAITIGPDETYVGDALKQGSVGS